FDSPNTPPGCTRQPARALPHPHRSGRSAGAVRPTVDNMGLAMRTTITRSAAALTAGWLLLLLPAARGGEGDVVRFNRDVRPILADTCFRCHGPAAKKAGLRLDRREVALKPTESGAVPIVPGDVEESEVIRRILSDDESEVMPPPDSRKVLTAEQ